MIKMEHKEERMNSQKDAKENSIIHYLFQMERKNEH